jgi:multidrug efflux pump subunit AcrB
VFVSVLFLVGPPRFLFTPMALAVVYAMLASYAISRTLVPILAALLLKGEERNARIRAETGRPPSILTRFGAAFDRGFSHLRDGYETTLTGLLASAWKVPVLALVLFLIAGALAPRVGQDFLPLGGRRRVSPARARRPWNAARSHRTAV